MDTDNSIQEQERNSTTIGKKFFFGIERSELKNSVGMNGPRVRLLSCDGDIKGCTGCSIVDTDAFS